MSADDKEVSANLKPCPFCGAELERREHDDGWVQWQHPVAARGKEMDCLFTAVGYRLPLSIFKRELSAWNKRAQETPDE